MSEIQKPFARWANFQECKTEMMTQQHKTEEEAGTICGAIEHRAEKGMLYKGAETLEVIKSKDNKMIIYGPASWETPDMEYPTPDYPTVEFQVNFLNKLLSMPEEYRNLSIDHQSLIMGKAVSKAVGADGQTYYSHVHEKGMMLVGEIRSDTNLGWVKKYREDIERGIYKMFSIRASNATREPALIDGKKVNKLLDGDPIEVAIVKQGMCQKAGPLEIVAKKAGKTIELVKRLGDLQKMSWEECIAQASADPDVDDPEALCGWLKANGSNAKSAEKPVEKPDLTAERIIQKYFPVKGDL